MYFGSSFRRSHRDWPAGTVTPRLGQIQARASRCAGGLCGCLEAEPATA